MQPTEVRQLFDLDAGVDVATAAEIYKGPAAAAGWEPVEVSCSRSLGSVSLDFVKRHRTFTATLQVYAYLERPPPDRRRRGLLVEIEGLLANQRPPESPSPSTEGLRRRDPGCLRGLDPADPALHPPAQVPASPEALCAILPIAQVKTVVPSIATAEPSNPTGPACRFRSAGEGGPNFTLHPAPEPRVYYEDRQAAPEEAAGRIFLLGGSPSQPPSGAWVQTAAGPVLVYSNLAPPQLLELCRLLSRSVPPP